MTEPVGSLPGAKRRSQSVTADWDPVGRQLIDGVHAREVRNVPTAYGYITELIRTDWRLDGLGVDQVFRGVFDSGLVSAWHLHAVTTDRLFVTEGRMLIVLFDGRRDSPTYRLVNEFRFGVIRPALVVVPPGVWHGVKNIGPESASLVNLVDKAYSYEQPDHWDVPADSPHVPYDILNVRGDEELPAAR